MQKRGVVDLSRIQAAHGRVALDMSSGSGTIDYASESPHDIFFVSPVKFFSVNDLDCHIFNVSNSP